MKAVCRTLPILLALFIAAPLFAQTEENDPRTNTPSSRTEQTPPRTEAWFRAQALLIDNFFQAPDGAASEDVLGGQAEIGARFRLRPASPLRVYGLVNYLTYDEQGLSSSPGVRVGIERQPQRHGFDVYAQYLRDRPSFDVGDEYDRADISSLVGEYYFRFTPDWQLSVDGELQEQRLDLLPERENDFGALGAAIRYRGWRRFSPEFGVRKGERDVVDSRQSYDQDEMYLQIRSSLTPAIYLSLRLRERQRDYTTSDSATSYFGREDERRQVTFSGDWTVTPSWVLSLYTSREEVETNLENRDFDTSLYVAGFTYRF